MNLHEYQGKSILRSYGVSVPEGGLAYTSEEAVEIVKQIELKTNQTVLNKRGVLIEQITKKTNTDVWAIKAQIHAGGRGKGGGIKIASNLEEVRKYAEQIIGMDLITPQTKAEGKKVRMVYVEQGIYYKGDFETQEFYVSILLNRQTNRNMILYSPRGGMDIETVAEETPELIFKEDIDPVIGLNPFQSRKIAFNLGLSGETFKFMVQFTDALYKAYIGKDASLMEINPVVKTSDNKIYAADSKVVIDNNALFRHPEIAVMRDFNEEDSAEVEAGKEKLNYIRLDGNIGCMVNGAGLAMATMDIIKLSGGSPANFLDVGGSADAERIEKGFRIILKDPNVKAILINIFGGIVRCDRVANGIVAAYKNLGEIKIPIIVRLQGTNSDQAKKIIDHSGLKVYSAIKLMDSANFIKKIL